MPSLPNLSTVITWFLYSIPIYIFVLDPLLRGFFPGLLPASSDSEPKTNKDIFDFDDATAIGPGLNLTDDSFISPEDGVPFTCPNAEGYRVHLLSRAPLVMYIENFVSQAEADHLLDVR